MRCVVTIDIPLLCQCDVFSVGESERKFLIDLLGSFVGNRRVALLFREQLWALMNYSDGVYSSMICSKLANLLLEPYSVSVPNKYMHHMPTLTDSNWGVAMNDEILLQLYNLYLVEDKTAYVLTSSRASNTEDVTITINHASKTTPLILLDEERCVQYFQTKQPHLDQHKHREEEWERGGKQVSPFSALKQGAEYAEDLLLQAYEEYRGEEEEPHYLYTWDKENGVYVQFRNSHQYMYHGMDATSPEVAALVPAYIREKYRK